MVVVVVAMPYMGKPDFAACSRDAILAFPDGEPPQAPLPQKASCTGYNDVPPPAIAWLAAWLLGRVQSRDYTNGAGSCWAWDRKC